MGTEKLIELYGRRFTPLSKLVGFITILIFGLLIAFNGSCSDRANETNINIEYRLAD